MVPSETPAGAPAKEGSAPSRHSSAPSRHSWPAPTKDASPRGVADCQGCVTASAAAVGPFGFWRQRGADNLHRQHEKRGSGRWSPQPRQCEDGPAEGGTATTATTATAATREPTAAAKASTVGRMAVNVLTSLLDCLLGYDCAALAETAAFFRPGCGCASWAESAAVVWTLILSLKLDPKTK